MATDGLSPEEAAHRAEVEARLAECSLGSMEQASTRGDGSVELGEAFSREDIDFGASLQHLKVHHGGDVAGSVFNGDVVKSPDEIRDLLKAVLPENLSYDQHGRAEITVGIARADGKPVGWSGVRSLEGIQDQFPGAIVEKKMRFPGGELATENGIEGAWYPETARDASGKFSVALDENGAVKNPHGKFEPLGNLILVPEGEFKRASATDKVTLILQKDKASGRPTVLTIFPGENAPAFPAIINSESYKADSTVGSMEARHWDTHGFIKVQKSEKTQ